MIRAGVILLLISFGNLIAQDNPALIIRFDKSIYSTGETVWFALIEADSEESIADMEVVHFELLSPRNTIILNGKVLKKGRLTEGYFRLPPDLEEGFYRFRAFTIKSLRNGGKYITADLPVYSEWREDLTVYKFEELPEKKSGKQDVQIDRKIAFHTRRDTVEYTDLLPAETESWQYIFWVQPEEFKEFPQIKTEIKNIMTPVQLYSNLEKEDSLYLEADLLQTNTDIGVSSPLISVYSSHNKRFYRSKAVDGHLSLKIPYYEGESTLQVFNLNPYQDAVSQLKVREWTINEGYFNNSKPVITAEIADYLIKAKQRRKIYDLFSLATDRTKMAAPDSGMAIPDLSYTMSDYRYINDLREFIFEAIPGAKILTQEDGSTTTRLYNPERRAIFVDRPWYIIDGYLTSREEEVLKIPFIDIDEIKLYVHTATIRKYFEYFLWRNGIIEVSTNDVKYKRSLKTDPNYVDFSGFIPEMEFLQNTGLSVDKNEPDLRTTMYWETGTWNKENKKIDFPLSDDTGRFTYHLVAISDSGEIIRKEGSFEVR